MGRWAEVHQGVLGYVGTYLELPTWKECALPMLVLPSTRLGRGRVHCQLPVLAAESRELCPPPRYLCGAWPGWCDLRPVT